MSDLVGMANEIKKVLAEVELKDAIGKLQPNDIMKVITTDGHIFRLDIISSVGGNFIVKNKKDGKEYTFGVNDFKNGVLTVYGYKGDGISVRGEPTEHEIKDFIMGTKGGQPMFIDPSGEGEPESDGEEEEELPTNPDEEEDLESDKVEFSQLLNTADEYDNIHISVNFPKEGSTRNDRDWESENEVTFIVKKVHSNVLHVNVKLIEGGKSKELERRLNNNEITINKKDSIYSENGQLKMKVGLKDEQGKASIQSIPHITYIGINKFENKIDLSGEERGEKTLSQDALLGMIDRDKHVNQMFDKSPTLKDTIMGASPTGLYQIAKMLKKAKLGNLYFKKNSKVKFKIFGAHMVHSGIDSLQSLNPDADNDYVGTVIKEKTLKLLGKINNAHWEIVIKDEVQENIYAVEYYAYKSENKGKMKDTGHIQVMDMNYNKNTF